MNCLDSQLILGQLYHCITGNAHEDIIIAGWRDQFPIYDEKNILTAPLRDMAIRGKHNCLIKAIANGFCFRQGIVNVDAGDFNLGWNHIIFRAVPGRDTAPGFIHVQVRSPGDNESQEVILQVMQAHPQSLGAFVGQGTYINVFLESALFYQFNRYPA